MTRQEAVRTVLRCGAEIAEAVGFGSPPTAAEARQAVVGAAVFDARMAMACLVLGMPMACKAYRIGWQRRAQQTPKTRSPKALPAWEARARLHFAAQAYEQLKPLSQQHGLSLAFSTLAEMIDAATWFARGRHLSPVPRGVSTALLLYPNTGGGQVFMSRRRLYRKVLALCRQTTEVNILPMPSQWWLRMCLRSLRRALGPASELGLPCDWKTDTPVSS